MESRDERILVTGGTGTLGRLVVPRLRSAGCKVRVLSRRSHEAADGVEFVTGDLATGEGVEAAVTGNRDHRALRGQHQGRRGQGPEPGEGSVAGRAAAPGVHLGRRRGPGPGRQRRRPRHVRLLRVEAGRGADRGRVRPALHDAARHPVPRPDPDDGAADGEAARDTGLRPASDSSRSTPARWRPGSRSSPSASRPGWCRTSAGRAIYAMADLVRGLPASRPIATGSSCRCGCRARPPARSGRARTWHPITPWAAGRGRSSWKTR